MRYFFLFIFSTVCFSIFADKLAISNCQKLLENANKDELSELYQSLALAYCKDQEIELGFKAFLKALELENKTIEIPKENGQKAFSAYIKQQSFDKILQEFMSCYLKDERDGVLGLVMGLCFLHTGQYENFMEIFYKAHQLSGDHFLKHKAKALLNIHLMQRARLVEEKQIYKNEISFHLKRALDFYSGDSKLYQLIILFAEKKNKGTLVDTLLNKIIDHNIVIPRADISFYMKQAVEWTNVELANKFIEKAAVWYPFSQIIDKERAWLDIKKLKEKHGN